MHILNNLTELSYCFESVGFGALFRCTLYFNTPKYAKMSTTDLGDQSKLLLYLRHCEGKVSRLCSCF